MLQKIRKLIVMSGVRPAVLVLPAFGSIAAALLEVVSLSLLIPTVQVLMSNDRDVLSQLNVAGMSFDLRPWVAGGATRREIFGALLAAFALTSIAKPLLQYASNVALTEGIRRLMLGMRNRIFSLFVSYDKSFYDKQGVGGLSPVVLQFTNQFAAGISQTKDSLMSIVLLVGYLGVMLQVSWKLTLFCLILIPAIMYIQKIIISKLVRSAMLQTGRVQVMTQRVTEVLRSMVLVQASNAQDFELKRFKELNQEICNLDYGIGRKQSASGSASELFTVVVGLVLLGAASFFFQRRGANFGPQFLVFFLAFRRFAGGVGAFSHMRSILGTLAGCTDQLLNAMEEQPALRVVQGLQPMPPQVRTIEVKSVSLKLQDREVLHDVSFSIPVGVTVGLVGPSGGGKSSILNLLMRFYDSTSGQILIDGVNVQEMSVASIRQAIGYIGQETHIFNDTLRFNLAYGFPGDANDEAMIAAMSKAQLGDFFKSLPRGLDTTVGENGVLLSGGERQRVAIARTILKNPPILILDEATSALDRASEVGVQRSLDLLAVGRTTIAVAHRLETLAHAHIVYVVEGGRIVGQTTGPELLANPGRAWPGSKKRAS